jgi:TonB family protein
MKSLLLSILFLLSTANTLAEEMRCTDTHAIRTIAPIYPLRQSSKPQTGYVVVSFKISDSGYVYNPNVIESHAEPSKGFAKLFEEEAVKAIKQFHFRYREKACIAEYRFTFEPKM